MIFWSYFYLFFIFVKLFDQKKSFEKEVYEKETTV